MLFYVVTHFSYFERPFKTLARGDYGNNVMKERVTKEESTGVKRQKEETKEEEWRSWQRY